MIKQQSIPILGKFEVIKVEEFNPTSGQFETQFERMAITFTNSSIVMKSLENSEGDNVVQNIREIYLQEETEQRKIFVLFDEDDSKILLITPGKAIQSEMDKPRLMLFDDELMTSGILFSLSRIL